MKIYSPNTYVYEIHCISVLYIIKGIDNVYVYICVNYVCVSMYVCKYMFV